MKTAGLTTFPSKTMIRRVRLAANRGHAPPGGAWPVDPVKLDEVEAEAADYATARVRSDAKLPAGWQILTWGPERHDV